MIKVERRIEVNNSWIILMYLSACIVGFLLTSLLLWFSGADISKAFYALYKGSMSNQKTVFNSLSKATPLILTGLATVVAFRAQVWSIGQEGQVYSGAMSAYMASLMFYGLPVWIYLSLIIAFGALGGALLGALSAVLKNSFKTLSNEPFIRKIGFDTADNEPSNVWATNQASTLASLGQKSSMSSHLSSSQHPKYAHRGTSLYAYHAERYFTFCCGASNMEDSSTPFH